MKRAKELNRIWTTPGFLHSGMTRFCTVNLTWTWDYGSVPARYWPYARPRSCPCTGQMTGGRERVYYSLGSATPKKHTSQLHRFRISQNRDTRAVGRSVFSHLCKTGRFCKHQCGWICCSEVRDEREREREREIMDDRWKGEMYSGG